MTGVRPWGPSPVSGRKVSPRHSMSWCQTSCDHFFLDQSFLLPGVSRAISWARPDGIRSPPGTSPGRATRLQKSNLKTALLETTPPTRRPRTPASCGIQRLLGVIATKVLTAGLDAGQVSKRASPHPGARHLPLVRAPWCAARSRADFAQPRQATCVSMWSCSCPSAAGQLHKAGEDRGGDVWQGVQGQGPDHQQAGGAEEDPARGRSRYRCTVSDRFCWPARCVRSGERAGGGRSALHFPVR